MPASSLEVADIVRAHGQRWRQAHAGHISLAQLKVMSAIETCRFAPIHNDVDMEFVNTNCRHYLKFLPMRFQAAFMN
ncbi:MAG: hypothetical protein ACI8XC_001738 [Gammaproteobacteria bacterium]|jgi:hypothetical protein